MKKEVRDALEVERRFRILNYLLSASKINAQLRDFGIAKSTFYRWKKAYEKQGKAGRQAVLVDVLSRNRTSGFGATPSKRASGKQIHLPEKHPIIQSNFPSQKR